MAAVALDSTRVLPRAALGSGYAFEFPALRSALEQVVSGTPSAGCAHTEA
jgi:NAD dependent epimerase/dehydratase family enzyme